MPERYLYYYLRYKSHQICYVVLSVFTKLGACLYDLFYETSCPVG
jgi:hypothetical protein